MACPAAEVELGDPGIQPFEPGGLAQLQAASLDGRSDPLHLRMPLHPLVVGGGLVPTPCIGAEQVRFQGTQIRLGVDEPQQNRFQSGVVLV